MYTHIISSNRVLRWSCKHTRPSNTLTWNFHPYAYPLYSSCPVKNLRKTTLSIKHGRVNKQICTSKSTRICYTLVRARLKRKVNATKICHETSDQIDPLTRLMSGTLDVPGAWSAARVQPLSKRFSGATVYRDTGR